MSTNPHDMEARIEELERRLAELEFRLIALEKLTRRKLERKHGRQEKKTQ